MVRDSESPAESNNRSFSEGSATAWGGSGGYQKMYPRSGGVRPGRRVESKEKCTRRAAFFEAVSVLSGREAECQEARFDLVYERSFQM
jgi:hypothetical protein